MKTELNPEQLIRLRKKNREAKQRSRAKQKQQSDKSINTQQAADEHEARIARNSHFFGETSPGKNAETAEEEIQIHREFLRALAQPDVQPGETLRQVAKRTFEAWAQATGSFESYRPAFNRGLQRFDHDYGFGLSGNPFEEIWFAPTDCNPDDPTDIASLPDLPKLSVLQPIRVTPPSCSHASN